MTTPDSSEQTPRNDLFSGDSQTGGSDPREEPHRVVVLSGGIGGARFITGLLHHHASIGAPAEVTVVANTADDIWLHGLKVCPDLDTVMYTLGSGIDQERGWDRTDETWHDK